MRVHNYPIPTFCIKMQKHENANADLSIDSLFFCKRYSLITAAVCVYKLSNTRYDNLYAHIAEVMRLYLLKSNK